MKKFIFSLIVAGLSLATFGCNEPSDPTVPTLENIILSQEQMNIDCKGGELSVEIYPNYECHATSNVDWIEIPEASISRESDHSTLHFVVKENSKTEHREGTITISHNEYNLSASLTVLQYSSTAFSLTINLAPETEYTKTIIGEKKDGRYPLYWSPKDNIACNGFTSGYTSIDKSGTVATFTFGDTPTPPYNVVYPAPSNGEVATKDGCYPVVFPKEQNYIKGSFDSGAAPMCGYATDTNPQFRKLIGVLRVAIKGDTTLSHIVVSAETGYISGVFDLDCQTGEVTPQEGKVSNQIEYKTKDGLQLDPNKAEPIYIAVPTGSYGMLSLSIYAVSGECMTVKVDTNKKPIDHNIREFELTFKPNVQ